MTSERIFKFILVAAGIAGTLFLFPFFLNAFAPFVASFFIASACQRLVRFLEHKFGLNRGISSAIIVTLIVVIFLGIFAIVIFQLLLQVKNLLSSLPDTINSFRQQFSELNNRYNGFRLSLPPDATAFIDYMMEHFQQYASGMSDKVTNSALEAAKNFAVSIPNALVFIMMLILGTFFFTKDYRQIVGFFQRIFPQKFINAAVRTKNILTKAFSSYMKAQFILMLLTSFLVTVCLWIIGKEYALLWGIICGLVDALPLLGTAAILIPWAIISYIYGDFYSFVALLIIQLLVFIVRQLAEPKIISKQIGIHPILTLVSIYVGLKYFGFLGVILAPIVTFVGVNLYLTYKEKL